MLRTPCAWAAMLSHALGLVEPAQPPIGRCATGPCGAMFGRMLAPPVAQRSRHALSSLKIAIHAAAPCPVPVKEQMIGWWGPIICEYCGATEGLGCTPPATAPSG